MTLYDLGYNETIDALAARCNTEGFQVGRVVSEQKERYCVFTNDGEYDAEITGNMRFTAQSREEFPAVGDWVLVSTFENGFAVIHAIVPRFSTIKRRAPEQRGGIQIIATNIDYAIIVLAADGDFNLNRVERYLAICGDSNVKSIIALTKIDLFDGSHVDGLLADIKARVKDVPVLPLSNETRSGFDLLKAYMAKGTTFCLLGSSGVGKSSLLNNLSGRGVMKTGETNSATHKGRHTTSYRELVVLEDGGILVDNPGMREVGMTDNDAGMAKTFSQIAELSKACKFSDCTHIRETGCAVLEALRDGHLANEVYENYLKMEKEKSHFASTLAETRKRDKDFGKRVKAYNKDKKLHKF